MKKKSIFIKLIAITLCFSFLTCSTIYASPATSTYSSEVGQFVAGQGPYATIKQIADIMFYLALGIAIIKLIQIGFKALTGHGKGLEQAKSSAIPWAIGLFLCLTWFTVGNYIITLLAGSSTNSNIFG